MKNFFTTKDVSDFFLLTTHHSPLTYKLGGRRKKAGIIIDYQSFLSAINIRR